jgi:hypothetical protein
MWFWPLSPRHFHSWRGAKGLSPWPWWHYSINEYYMVTLFLDTWIKAVLWIWSCIILLQKNHRFLVNATTLVFCFLASLPLTYIFFLQTFSLLQIAQCCLMDCTCTAAMSRPLLTHKAVLFCKDMNGWSYSLQNWNLAKLVRAHNMQQHHLHGSGLNCFIILCNPNNYIDLSMSKPYNNTTCWT